MKIFVTGATGWVGQAVLRELRAHGHDVTGLVRMPQNTPQNTSRKAQALHDLGARIVAGSIEDHDLLRAQAAAADAVIHTAFNHDFSKFAENAEIDRQAIEALGDALYGSDRPLIVTSGLSRLAPPGRGAIETDRPDPGGPRKSEVAAQALAARGVNVSTVRLAPTTHGIGEHGFVSTLIGIARQSGVAAYPGQGLNEWSAVHRDDAAVLFRLAVEQGASEPVYHAVAQEGVAMRDIMTAIGRQIGLPVESRDDDHFGWFAMFAKSNMTASSDRTRAVTGWVPRGATLLSDLGQAAYYQQG